jgi:hypothetical protein
VVAKRDGALTQGRQQEGELLHHADVAIPKARAQCVCFRQLAKGGWLHCKQNH